LIAVRQDYDSARNSILDRAQARHEIVKNTITDLQEERAALELVATQAREG
jgi:hypothetical protein